LLIFSYYLFWIRITWLDLKVEMIGDKPEVIAEELHSAGYASILMVPSQQGTHAPEDSLAESPSGEYHAAGEWICI
jgi:hypothetical protein